MYKEVKKGGNVMPIYRNIIDVDDEDHMERIERRIRHELVLNQTAHLNLVIGIVMRNIKNQTTRARLC